MLRLIEVLCWLVAFFATVAMRVLRVIGDLIRDVLVWLLEVLEAFAKWCKRMYLSIEAYVRMFCVRVAWLLIQLLRLSIAFSPAIGAFLAYVLFWPHSYLLWTAVGWAVLMLIMGLALSLTLGDQIHAHAPTKQEFAKMEHSFTADLFVTAFRCMPGVLAIVYSYMIPVKSLIVTFSFWGGIIWAMVAIGVLVVSWLNPAESQPTISLSSSAPTPNAIARENDRSKCGQQLCVLVVQAGEGPGQGVGYLDDGTMVVVQGGGDYLGKMIETTISSVLETSVGRMIFTRSACAYETSGGHNPDYDQAIADCTRAIELDPKDAWAYAHRGAAHRQKEDYDQAIADFSRAIELDPKDPTSYEWRAEAYEARGDADKAVQDRAEAERLKAQTA